jgi:hypothetical protein
MLVVKLLLPLLLATYPATFTTVTGKAAGVLLPCRTVVSETWCFNFTSPVAGCLCLCATVCVDSALRTSWPLEPERQCSHQARQLRLLQLHCQWSSD